VRSFRPTRDTELFGDSDWRAACFGSGVHVRTEQYTMRALQEHLEVEGILRDKEPKRVWNTYGTQFEKFWAERPQTWRKMVFFNGVVKETALVILTPSLEPCLAPLHPHHVHYYAMRNAATYLDTLYVGVFLVAYKAQDNTRSRRAHSDWSSISRSNIRITPVEFARYFAPVPRPSCPYFL
jgi:hypothetical protein